MSDATYRLVVRTPEATAFDDEAASAVLPGLGGFYGVFPGHAPMLGSVAPGILDVRTGGGRRWFVVGGGFCEVGLGRVEVFVDAAIAVPDPAEAEERLEAYVREIALAPTAATPAV